MRDDVTNSFEKSGDGKVIEIESGQTIFKLDSHESNPIVRPQDIGLVWNENGESRIGDVFNGGAAVFGDKFIPLPRRQCGFSRGKFFDEQSGVVRIVL